MAKTNLYQLYDIEAGTVHGPMFATPRHGAACRAFSDILKNKDTLPAQYPEHFDLIWIGEQDLETGEIFTMRPQQIMNGGKYIASLHAAEANEKV